MNVNRERSRSPEPTRNPPREEVIIEESTLNKGVEMKRSIPPPEEAL
jgi:hypothetical protein